MEKNPSNVVNSYNHVDFSIRVPSLLSSISRFCGHVSTQRTDMIYARWLSALESILRPFDKGLMINGRVQ